MAELIDKTKFIEWFKESYKTEQIDEDTGETTEYDVWISSVDVIDDIERFKPTTTESEIRAKAIDEFAEKFIYKVHCEGCSGCTNCYETGAQDNCDTYRYYAEIAEQLKGE